MGAVAAAAAASAITGAVQAGIGVAQYFGGKKREKKLGDQPEYEVQDELYDNLKESKNDGAVNTTRVLANTGIAGAQRSLYEENIARGTATQLRGISSRKGGLMGVTAAAQTAQDGYRGLLAMDADARLKNQMAFAQQQARQKTNILNSNTALANAKDIEYQINKLDPYQQELNYARSLQGAGMQNAVGGLDSFAGNKVKLAELE